MVLTAPGQGSPGTQIGAAGQVRSGLSPAGYRAAYAAAEDNLRLGRAFLAASVRLNLGCAATEVVTATGARSVREPFAGLISRVPLSGVSRSRATGSDVDVDAFGPDGARLVTEIKAQRHDLAVAASRSRDLFL
jgi:hypothetical protein